ncbi:MAG: hypothetical protein C5B44_02545 [Acidobacteria bacterium]|nr:MAG: hypothetical protein C5B44_02545 [Acidobacteriota bacterium]
MRKCFAAACLLSLFAVALTTFADVARPNPSKEAKVGLHSGLEIVPDDRAFEARLEIPQDTWKEMRAGLTDIPTDPTWTQRIVRSSLRTVVAGTFLFLSFAFAGVWLARSKQRNQRIAAALLLGGTVVSAATIIARANAGPPGYLRWQGLPAALTEGRTTRGGVDIVIVPTGSTIKLIIPMKKVVRTTGEE